MVSENRTYRPPPVPRGAYDDEDDEEPEEDSYAGVVILVVGLLLVALGAVAYFVWPRINEILHPAPVTSAPYIPPPSTGPASSPDASPTDNRVPILHVTTGVCFMQQALQESGQTYIWPIDCSQPHDAEVFYADSLPAGDYPDTDGWKANADQYCHPAFQTYVGIDFNLSKLDSYYVFPPQDVWDAGNRILVCYAVDPAGPRTTSVAGTNQ